ncbi:MAG: GTP-binding protein [Candidatus Cryosericum sp.]
MSLIDFSKSEITFKVVYYGPAMSGKTTNLGWIFRTIPEKVKGQFTSIATETERTLFFDFLPVELGTVKGFKIRLSLYTVPGQELYKLTRKSVLKSVDGIVFVADSNRDRRQDNMNNLADMFENLKDYGLRDTPVVYQLNKRDLPDIMSVSELVDDLHLSSANSVFLGMASSGVSVMECLKGITREVVSKI